MKDLEKIKSEDLGCQVADANPGNFAIEQEVAQLVGATVPSPTEPSADDARELGAQLLVFLRRALLPIRSALRTALAAIYAHLDSRCTDYTPAAYAPYQPLPSYDPMRPFAPRTLPNLLTAITAFADRKMVPGLYDANGNELIVDGMSIIRYLASDTSNMRSQVARIIDNNYGWTVTSNIFSQFPNVTYAELGFDKHLAKFYLSSSSLEELHLRLQQTIVGYYDSVANYRFPNAVVYADELTSLTYYSEYGANWCYWIDCKELYIRGLREIRAKIVCRSAIQKVVFGIIDYVAPNDQLNSLQFIFNSCPDLIHIEFERLNCSFDMSGWNPTNVLADADKTATFLQNFKDHIALRLTDQGSGKTLTLSQAVFDTIWNQDGTPKSTDPDSVIYQINKIIKTDKHWSVNRA